MHLCSNRVLFLDIRSTFRHPLSSTAYIQRSARLPLTPLHHCERSGRKPLICNASYRKAQKPAPAPQASEAVQSPETASLTMTPLVSRPSFLLATAVGFSIIAFDINSPASLHILPQYFDQPTHAWVKSNLPVPIKKLVAEKLVSDLFITGGIAGWVAAASAGIAKTGWPGVKRLVIAMLLYVLGGGSVRHGKACWFKSPLHSCIQAKHSAALSLAGMLFAIKFVILFPSHFFDSRQSPQVKLCRPRSVACCVIWIGHMCK